MGTSLHNFIGIFASSFNVNDEDVKLTRIVIPIIQRDYAQGRLEPEVERVRTRFLESLHQGIADNPITLDFVYGDIKGDGMMTPLDGQQRLTTLFLLHWYAAKKEKIDAAEYAFLENFSYETRYSAREFCSLLIRFTPSFEKKISEEIVDQSWFPLDWKKDPTISSMLVMIDAISSSFSDIHDIWSRLNNNAITFYFLPIKDMGLTDELYIKMNSRGKPLTQFEHFKAELEHELSKIDPANTKQIIQKIDCNWTDMLWRYKGNDNATDDEFLRYFKFICDVIYYQNSDTPQGKSNDEFDLLKKFFSDKNDKVKINIQTLERYFDCWCDFNGEYSPDQFLAGIISNDHVADKIKVENRYRINIFEDCLQNYADLAGNGNRRFPLNRIVLLYAIISYLLNKDTITASQFSRRLRIVNNLVQNSEDEISDSEQRSGGNRMPAILKQVDCIITTGKIDLLIENNFNLGQLNEEVEKSIWLEDHPNLAENLCELEDHELLYGQIGIVGLEHPEYFERFNQLFSCNKDTIDCALISVGDYSQRERNGWRYQMGSQTTNAWRALFHQSANSGFEKTKEVLEDLLSRSETITDAFLMEITNTYITNCENSSSFDWRYYYIKYDIFRPGSYGKYYWENKTDSPYEFIVMKTEQKISENSYQPFLKAADEKNISKDYYGDRLIIGDFYIMCENCSYVFKYNETDAEINRIRIAQNENGIDQEDRILILQDALSRDELVRMVQSNAGARHPYPATNTSQTVQTLQNENEINTRYSDKAETSYQTNLETNNEMEKKDEVHVNTPVPITVNSAKNRSFSSFLNSNSQLERKEAPGSHLEKPMTVIDEVRETFKDCSIGTILDRDTILKSVNAKFGRALGSIIPSDYCYNRTNNGINKNNSLNIFEYIDLSKYKYLGENYPYNGKVSHKSGNEERLVAEWVDGVFKWL